MDHKTFIPASGVDQAVKVNALLVSVYYSKGGANYFTGNVESGAIWASIMPVERNESRWSTMMFHGLKVALEPASRLNQKRVAAAFEQVKADIATKTGKVWAAVLSVLAKHNLTLPVEAPAQS